ncbi:lipopolysaccharide biosynthesis protein [Sphingomonas limnosediminicola]|uniref:Lipopolysaccharide biosynthesis protein n=1 Tax=Sphingomonas limnosediminicola TaxID=940133 RepID=A0ABP7KVB9_9SPHN
MRHWFKDQHFRSLLKNSSYLAISRVVAAIAGIATLSLAAHALGVLAFGALILITSYAKAVSGLSKFQSWHLIVRYGGKALHGEEEDFKTSTGFAFALDAISGVGGMLVAVAILPLVATWVGIQSGNLWLAMLYCTLLPTMGAATPSGVLRALDRFDLISWQSTATPISRIALVSTAYFAGAPFGTWVGIWYVTDLAGDLYLWFLAWRELRRRGLLEGIRPTLKPERLPGAWRFAIHVNLTASVQAAWGPIARVVVGGLLGPAGAALFRVASALSDAAAKPAELLAKAFYPEVVRMDLTSKKPWKLMFRVTALAGGMALIAILILLVGGKPLVGFLFGKQFLGAYEALVVLMLVPFLGVLSFPLPPMLYTLDRPDAPLTARLIGTVSYFLIVAPLCWRFGLIGAAIAFTLGNVATTSVMIWQLLREHRRVRPRKPTTA